MAINSIYYELFLPENPAAQLQPGHESPCSIPLAILSQLLDPCAASNSAGSLLRASGTPHIRCTRCWRGDNTHTSHPFPPHHSFPAMLWRSREPAKHWPISPCQTSLGLAAFSSVLLQNSPSPITCERVPGGGKKLLLDPCLLSRVQQGSFFPHLFKTMGDCAVSALGLGKPLFSCFLYGCEQRYL